MQAGKDMGLELSELLLASETGTLLCCTLAGLQTEASPHLLELRRELRPLEFRQVLELKHKNSIGHDI